MKKRTDKMALVNLIGDVGSGKSLYVVRALSRTTERPLANFHINIPNFTLLTPEMLVTLTEGSEVGIDEAYSWLESRTSARKINLFLSYILFQARKRHMTIYTTDQLLDTIDVRFRKMANWVIECESIDNGFLYRIQKQSRYKLYHPIKKILTEANAKKYYKIYDSWELIDPIDENLMLDISSDKSKILESINCTAKNLLDLYPANKINLGICKHYCLENKIPVRLHSDIYHAVKTLELKSLAHKNG